MSGSGWVSWSVVSVLGALLVTSCSDSRDADSSNAAGAGGVEVGGAACGGGGLHCLRADQDYPGGVGAPPSGLCTAVCEADADCRGFDPNSTCGTLDEYPIMLGVAEEPAPRLCMAGCGFGEPTGESKCH